MADLSSIEGAAHRLGEPDVTAAELAQIAGAHPALRAIVARHPMAYPELRAWIEAASATPPAAPVTPETPGRASAATAPAIDGGGQLAAVPTQPAVVPTQRAAGGGAPAWLPWAVAALAVVVAAGSWLWPHPGSAAASASPSASTNPSGSTAAPTGGSAATGGTAATGSAAAFATDEGTFATPQAAVTFLAQRLAAGDAAGAATAFATTSAVDGYDFATQLARINAMMPSIWLPSSSPYYRTLNLGQRAATISGQLRLMTWSVVDPQDDPTTTLSVTDPSAVADLAKRLDPAAMSQLTVLHVDQLGVEHPNFTANFPQLAAPYGADEYAQFAVLYSTANGPMAGGMSFLRYGDRWLIFDLSAGLLDIDIGKLTPSSEQDYTAMIAPLT